MISINKENWHCGKEIIRTLIGFNIYGMAREFTLGYICVHVEDGGVHYVKAIRLKLAIQNIPMRAAILSILTFYPESHARSRSSYKNMILYYTTTSNLQVYPASKPTGSEHFI